MQVRNYRFIIIKKISTTFPFPEFNFKHRLVLNEGRKCFIYDALNTFYLRLYVVIHMVKDHSDSERGIPLPPLHGLLFPISSKLYFICNTPTDRTAHTTAFVTPAVEHWPEREIAQWGHHE